MKNKIKNLIIFLTTGSLVFFVGFYPVLPAGAATKTTTAAATAGVRNAGTLFIKTSAKAPAKLTRDAVLEWTNTARAENGNLRPVFINSTLNTVAQQRLRDMFKKQYFAHISPSGLAPSEVASGSGYEFLNFGENIAMGNFEGDQTLVNAWMNSPRHRENILDSKYKEIGIAVGKGKYKGKLTWIAVQSFGRPRPNCAEPDESLPKLVYADNTKIDTLLAEANSIKNSLNSAAPQTPSAIDEFNKKAGEYNALVPQINGLIDEAKQAKDKYNAQVDAFNICIKQ